MLPNIRNFRLVWFRLSTLLTHTIDAFVLVSSRIFSIVSKRHINTCGSYDLDGDFAIHISRLLFPLSKLMNGCLKIKLEVFHIKCVKRYDDVRCSDHHTSFDFNFLLNLICIYGLFVLTWTECIVYSVIQWTQDTGHFIGHSIICSHLHDFWFFR